MGMPFAEADKVAKLVPEPVQGKIAADRRGDRAGAAPQGSSTTRARRTASCSTSPTTLEGLNRHAGMHAAGVVIGEKPAVGVRPVLPPGRRRGGHRHPVRQGRGREGRAGQVRLPRPQDADRDPDRRRPDQRASARARGEARARHRRHPARRRRRLQDDLAGRHHRRVPARIVGLPRAAQEAASPTASRTSSPRSRSTGPGPLEGGMVDDFIERKHGRKQVEYAHPSLEPILQGHLRRHRLPGAGHADRLGAGRLLARRGRPAPPRDGQEEGRGDGQGEGQLPRRARKDKGVDAEDRRARLRPDGEVRRLRLQPQPLGRLRADHLPDRVPQAPLPGRVLRRRCSPATRTTPTRS